jgi:site-specific DNA-methyltransferase (cytosine-N4-specific)
MTEILNDQNIINCLSNKSEEFWDFKTGFEKVHIHGIAKYPATMVPRMQAELMDILLKETSIESMLDPFMGSGTSIVLGLDRGLNVTGFDINPLAYLISKVKSQRYDLVLLNRDYNSIEKEISSNQDFDDFSFEGIDKWFKADIINQLSRIRHSIIKTEFNYPDFVALAFAETVKVAGNSRTSTSKLHIKTAESILDFEIDCSLFFMDKLNSMIAAVHDYQLDNDYMSETKVFLKCGNSYDLLNQLEHKVDLIITSPPYGDNGTTVAYGQFSILQLRWLNGIFEELNESVLDRLTGIDSKSLGGIGSFSDEGQYDNLIEMSPTFCNIMDLLYEKENKKKIRKVKTFFEDLYLMLGKLYEKLNIDGYALFTTGNRVVDGITIPLDQILIEVSEGYRLEKVYRFERNILKKRYPSKVSIDRDNNKVKSIDRETVILLKKKGDA